jgi:hypothetical protein
MQVQVKVYAVEGCTLVGKRLAERRMRVLVVGLLDGGGRNEDTVANPFTSTSAFSRCLVKVIVVRVTTLIHTHFNIVIGLVL